MKRKSLSLDHIAADRALRNEQDREYRESLEIDKAKRKERLDKERQQQEFEFRTQQRLYIITCFRATLNPDDYQQSPAKSVVIQIRFPGGERLITSFTPEDRIEKLFEAAHLHPDCPFFFKLHASYPRKELHAIPFWSQNIAAAHQGDAPGLPPPENQIKMSPEMEKRPWLRSFGEAGLKGRTVVLLEAID
ncbi:unnamed protein product, partial [Mesorhabditis spiculigera]